MNKSENLSSSDPARRWILAGMPVLILAGFPMHFIFEWTGRLSLIGALAPVNESIWEHLKLAFWPMLIWWLAGYLILRRKAMAPGARWILAGSAAALACPLVIIIIYYVHTGALGTDSFIVDIFSFVAAVVVSQGLALHIFRYARTSPWTWLLAISILAALVFAFTFFTFAPPHLPVFQDSLSGKYGLPVN